MMASPQSSDPTLLEAQITALATEELHINRIAFAPIRPVQPQAQASYQAWIEAGQNADMRYLEENTNLRFDPSQQLLPEAKSVIVIAVSYYPEALQPPHAPQLSKYAYGRNYHKVLKKLLTQLGNQINERIAPHHFRAIVDTVPFMERYWAHQAGLGFIGKNSNLIIPGLGSYFFLGELLTTLPLTATAPPLAQRCGNCSRCIDGCPTGALSAEHGLDARKCISYLTIEHRGDIPTTLSRKFGNRLYGCDTCQDLCPYNNKPPITYHFPTAPQVLTLSDHHLRPLTPQQYEALFHGTGATRAKYEGMKRNAEIYLQNKKNNGGML